MQSQKDSHIESGGTRSSEPTRGRTEIGDTPMNEKTDGDLRRARQAAWDRDTRRREFLTKALQHDAVQEAVTELLFDHVVLGKCHWTVVAASLEPILHEAYEVADEADWQAVARYIADPDAPVDDPAGSRRSKQGSVFDISLIRAFLRSVAEDPFVAERLRSRPEVSMEEGIFRTGAVRDEVTGAVRSGTEEDRNIIAGQLIAEAREVSGPAAAEGAAA